MVIGSGPRPYVRIANLILAVCAVAFSGCAWAQSDSHVVPLTAAEAAPRPAGDAAGTPLRSRPKPIRFDVDLVLVPVTITDRKGHPVTDLAQRDFSLFEGEEPQPIRYFSHEDTPISLGVILDISKSMSDKIDTAREAVAEFFQESNPHDDYFVVTFDDRPSLLADSTQSIGDIQDKLAKVTPRGRTALLDAIYLGIQKAHRARYKRRALLIISDGGDNSSRYSAREIRNMVQEADVEIYAIGIFDSFFRTPEEWSGKKLLTQITEATGGRTVTLSNLAKLPEIAAQVSQELRSQYVLGYRPAHGSHDGKWRRIKVQVSQPDSPERLQVYSKRGYYAPGE